MEKIQDEIHDERNKLIDSYSKSLTFSIIQYILIISEILLMLIYYYTNNEVFITFLIPIGLIVFLTFVIHFIALIYYEKKL
ncbi:hypothetical protein lbkm_1076 [Lachnospiraceae bacterium KM106-2]|nr:hypothetical protein lbkm_1076 [Lachnospiraceae bacterium KM106-2]